MFIPFNEYLDTLPEVIPGNDYELVVEHSWGTATATVKCPDAEGFRLTQPIEVEMGSAWTAGIVEGTDLTLEWDEAADADWYGMVWDGMSGTATGSMIHFIIMNLPKKQFQQLEINILLAVQIYFLQSTTVFYRGMATYT